MGVVSPEIPVTVWDRVIQEFGKKTQREVYSDIGSGRNAAATVARRLAEYGDVGEVPQSQEDPAAPLLVRRTEGMDIQLASCCQPIPGDPIIGLLRVGRGLLVHVQTCQTIKKLRSSEPQDWIPVEWEPEPGQLFNVRIKVMIKNGQGVLGRVATSIARAGINIEYVNMDRRNTGLFSDIHFLVQVQGRAHLAQLIRDLRRTSDVVRITREQETL